MNKIKIFINGSLDKFNVEIAEVGDFIRELNDCYLDKGLYFSLIKSGGIDNEKPGEYKSALAGCDLAFFLLSTNAEQNMTESLDAALDCYRKNNKPKVITYFKTDNAQPPTEEVEKLKKHLEGETDYYYNTYNHIDTLKLGLLMNIKQLDLDSVDIRLEDGKAWQSGEVLLSLDHVEMVSGYEDLQRLKTERAVLENNFYAAKTKYAENPEDSGFYETYYEASRRRNEAVKEIRGIEERLYSMIEGMYEQTSQGRLSKRQVEGYRLMERGLFKEAAVILDFDGIIRESRHDDEIVNQAAKRAQIHVNELLQLKDVNATLRDWEGVDACYQEAVKLEEKYGLPLKATISLDPADTDYLTFLVTQYRHDEAARLGEKLRRRFQKTKSGDLDEIISYILNILGIIYSESQRMAEAEETLKESLAIRIARTDGDPDAIAKDIAIVYNTLGNMYYMSEKFDEAAQAHKAALEIRENLVKRNPDAYEKYLAYTYVNLGAVYDEVQKYKESFDMMTAARDIFKKLAENNPDAYEEYLADCYKNIGISYTRFHRYEEAEKQFISALEIELEQAEGNPGIYEPRVAESSLAFGRALFEAKRYAESEEKLKSAQELYKKLANRTPDAFEPELAKCCFNLGELYSETNRITEAADALSSAIRLYDKYKESNPVFERKTFEAQKLLDSLNNEQNRQDAVFSQFTPEEREVALLLTEGGTQRDIARKLKLTSDEVELHVKAIREKVSMGEYDPKIAAVEKKYELSRREVHILKRLSRDMSNADIAAELFITEETVRSHIHRLLKKLPVENRNGVAAWLESFNE